MYDSVFDHELVGMHVRTPAPADKSRHAMQPMLMWLWMTKEAAKRDRKRLISGQMVYLRRGQLAVSYRYFAEKANWGMKTTRLFLERLADFDMITLSTAQDADQLRLNFSARTLNGIQKGTGVSVISICNYETYQRGSCNKGTTRAQEGHRRGTGGAQNLTTNIDTEEDRGAVVTFTNGRIAIFGRLRAFWLEKFGNEEDLELALLQATPYIQPNASMHTLEAKVSSQLARQASYKRTAPKAAQAPAYARTAKEQNAKAMLTLMQGGAS